jgi:hypothetical protein
MSRPVLVPEALMMLKSMEHANLFPTMKRGLGRGTYGDVYCVADKTSNSVVQKRVILHNEAR